MIVVGSNGRLGRALLRQSRDRPTLTIGRRQAEAWTRNDGASHVESDLSADTFPGQTIYVASGVLDPGAPNQLLKEVNINLPRNIVAGTASLGLNVVTFGTVLEIVSTSPNAYVASKKALAAFLTHSVGNDEPVSQRSVCHVRLHTLYGGGNTPHFMFLGQIIDSLRNNSEFKMTSGEQLREYHHVDDVARAVLTLKEQADDSERQSAMGPTCMTLSHGRPVQLSQLAKTIFAAFDAESLLKIGALPDPTHDNYERTFDATRLPRPVRFRDTLSSVAACVRAELAQ